MQRTMAVTSLAMLVLAVFVWTTDTWARAGGGKSTGSRGSRSWSSPEAGPSAPSSSRQAVPPSAVQQPMPQRSGWMSGLMGGIMGFALGGLLGSMLFGGLGGGLFNGIGLLEILLIGGLLYMGFAYLRRRQRPVPVGSYGYAPPQGVETPSWQSESMDAGTAPMAASESDRDRGLRHIRHMDSAFDPVSFTKTASESFCKIQSAWMARGMGPVRDLMTLEMYEQMQKDCERLQAERRINRLENIAMRYTEVTEAWQESGQDFVTVRILASLLDYTVEEGTQRVLEGSSTDPVKCEEYWTFTRPVGPHPWQLSAIQQAA